MKRTAVWFLLPLAILSAANAQITVEVVGDGSGYDLLGSASNPEVAAYRSTDILKTFDADGDNAYGTLGVLAFGNGGARINKQPFTLRTQVGIGWAKFSAGENFWTIAQNVEDSESMDSPIATVGGRVSDWGSVGMLTAYGNTKNGNWVEMLSFKFGRGAPQSFRMGLIAGTQFTKTGHWDPTGLRVTADGGKTFATVTDLENNENGHANLVFFDIHLNGADSGTLAIWGQQKRRNPVQKKREYSWSNNIEGASLTAIVFDEIPDSKGHYVDIPEPKGYGLWIGCMALASVTLRRGVYL